MWRCDWRRGAEACGITLAPTASDYRDAGPGERLAVAGLRKVFNAEIFAELAPVVKLGQRLAEVRDLISRGAQRCRWWCL